MYESSLGLHGSLPLTPGSSASSHQLGASPRNFLSTAGRWERTHIYTLFILCWTSERHLTNINSYILQNAPGKELLSLLCRRRHWCLKRSGHQPKVHTVSKCDDIRIWTQVWLQVPLSTTPHCPAWVWWSSGHPQRINGLGIKSTQPHKSEASSKKSTKGKLFANARYQLGAREEG